MKKSDSKNILVINFGGIGDEILFLPTLVSLKKTYPDSVITLALEPRSKGIKDLTNVIDDLILVDIKGEKKYSELLKLVLTARWRKFDMVISSGGNKLISILLAMMGIKHRYGYDTGRLSRILLTKAVPLNKNQYASLMYHDLISPLTDIRTEVPQINIESLQRRQNTVLIHPGVSKLSVEKGMIKTISPEKWAKLIDLLVKRGVNVILAGGPDDAECIDIIRNTVEQSFEDYYGKTKNLKELAALIASVDKFVCSDSAPLHIGVGLGVKTYVVFGPTDPSKLIPQTDRVIPLGTNNDCPLKPCLWERRNTTCDKLQCLDIDIEKMADIILKN